MKHFTAVMLYMFYGAISDETMFPLRGPLAFHGSKWLN